jgi:DNA-binding winged helix-turn-helix (wHTH) protein/dienelactone hydrolase
MGTVKDEQRVTFGDYSFDLRSATLFKLGRRIRVPDQSLKVLASLLETPGETITREELCQRLWPNGTHVEFEQGLNSVVKRLRAVLLDSPTAPRYIETVPKRGYCFIYPIQRLPVDEVSRQPVRSGPTSGQVAASMLSGPRLPQVKPSHRVVALLALLAVLTCTAILYQRAGWQSWAAGEVFGRARSLAAESRYSTAYDLVAAQASQLPVDDQRVAQLWPLVSRKISVVSQPSGALVSWRPYADLRSPWRALGKTPLSDIRVSAGTIRLRLSKSGYRDLEVAAAESNYQLSLERIGSPDMVRIPEGPVFAHYAGVGRLGPVTVNGFWIDRTEVTNSEYQRFVSSGGYRNPQYWTFPFIEKEHILNWSQAIARFTDQTGTHSPAGWLAGGYPVGEGNYPVSGVSWYEAAAYANFAGKALPNVYQWFRAAHTDDSAFMIALSNFDGRGAVPVGSRGAVGSFGVYDMAGDVREWCFNQSGAMRFILGGAWSDPAYMFVQGQKLPPLNRSATNGFRCVADLSTPNVKQPRLSAPLPPPLSDQVPFNSGSDENWRAFAPLYAYDHSDLNPTVESIKESDLWHSEKVRFRGGYRNQVMTAYLFLPKHRPPPYQCVVYVPSGDAFQAKSGDTIQPLAPLLSSGRAIIYPIFWGTFDRFVGMPPDRANSGYPSPTFIREGLTAWRKDLGRTLDYLQTRKDIGQIGYLGVSTGAEFAPVMLAGEGRVKAAVLLSGALPVQMKLMAESNPVNFASGVTIPVLMLNGRYDSILTEEAQMGMFRLLGTHPSRKAHILVDSGHGVFAPEVRNKTIHEILAWFDRYLGPV